MAAPWLEIGLIVALTGVLGAMAQTPVPLIEPADVGAYEGRTVRVGGFAQDVQLGIDSHRGVLAANGHGIRFSAKGSDLLQEGAWVELQGTLTRQGAWLVLVVESDAWNW
jgi:hypothetical protein